MVFEFSFVHYEQKQGEVFDGYRVLLLHACVATRGIHHCCYSVVILFVWMPPQSPTMRMVRVKCHLAYFWCIYQQLVLEVMCVYVCVALYRLLGSQSW